MFLLLFALATFSAEPYTDLSKTNEALRQVLRELQVGDMQAKELMTDESLVGQKNYYGLKGRIGSCEAGKALTLEQCKNEVSFGEGWGGSGLYGNSWWNKESCGCYLDQNGKRYFNTQTNKGYCKSDYGEKLICIVPPPPKTCHKTFKFLETDDGKCSASLTFPSNSCPNGYRRIRTKKECQDLVTKGAKNIHWRGSHSPRETNWPKGCVVHKAGGSFYQAYFNTKSSDCHKCDKEIAPLCKLV